MPRLAKSTDFRITVQGVGDFVFGRRTMRDEIAVQVEYARFIDGVQPTQWLQVVAGAMADLMVLTVAAPPGWDLEALDPADPDTYTRLIAVHQELLQKERSFRPGNGAERPAAGPAAARDDQVPVPAQVQPAAHG